MATKANVKINDRELRMDYDGDGKEDILAIVREYVQAYKGKVNPEILAKVVVNGIVADGAGDDYATLRPGSHEWPFIDYTWEVIVTPSGEVSITGGSG